MNPPTTQSIRNIFRRLLEGTRAEFVVPWLLAGFAVCYYSLYVNSGLNLGGEGGRPIADTFLGST